MREIIGFWPVIVYVFAIWANTDIIIPAVIFTRKAPLSLGFVLVSVIGAEAELIYSFWFWKWVFSKGPELESLIKRRAAASYKNVILTFFNGVLVWILEGITRGYKKVSNPSNQTKRNIDKWGVMAVWGAGLNPIPGIPTRGPCSAFLGFYKLHREFLHLLVANAIHVLFVLYLLSLVVGQ